MTAAPYSVEYAYVLLDPKMNTYINAYLGGALDDAIAEAEQHVGNGDNSSVVVYQAVAHVVRDIHKYPTKVIL